MTSKRMIFEVYARHIATFVLFVFCFGSVYAQGILDSNAQGIDGKNLGQSYDFLLDTMLANDAVVTSIGNKMWVPWYSSSSKCGVGDLQSGGACNAPQIDSTHNCMVTDEFSQVGIIVSMGKDQNRMDEFYNTLPAIQSTNGKIPAWRIYKDGDQIKSCESGINGNCDTASDGTARIIISLFTAANNPYFTDVTKKAGYLNLAKQLAIDMLYYEVDRTCRPSDLGYGDICNWLAAGSEAKRGGLSSFDYAYTGYYPDAIIAMLMACTSTGDTLFCDAAKDFGLNYLQAAKFDGSNFRTPPGKSFRWINLGGVPSAECTGSCFPVKWDDADAPRALGICQANYYAKQIGVVLPGMDAYCGLWEERYLSDPTKVPLQYYPDGSMQNYQSGYFAQGLQSLSLMDSDNKVLYKSSLANAPSHFSSATKTWDYTQCFGVYHPAFVMRSLGSGLGRDLFSGAPVSVPDPVVPDNTPVNDPVNPPADTSGGSSSGTPAPADTQTSKTIADMRVSIDKGTLLSDVTVGTCRTVKFDSAGNAGEVRVLACEKDGGKIEVYRQAAPSGLVFRACVGSGCVDQYGGFASFIPVDADYVSVQADSGQSSVVNDTPTGTSDTVPPVVDATPPTSDATPPAADVPIVTGKSVGDLRVSIDKGTLLSDVIVGTCRTVKFDSAGSAGEVRVLACEKDGGKIEVYRQAAPSGLAFRACVGSGCVDEFGGFASFIPTDADYYT